MIPLSSDTDIEGVCSVTYLAITNSNVCFYNGYILFQVTPTSGTAIDTLFEIKAVWQQDPGSNSMMFKYFAMDSGKTSKKNMKYLGNIVSSKILHENLMTFLL